MATKEANVQQIIWFDQVIPIKPPRKWTTEEDSRLCEAIRIYGYGERFSWQCIAKFVETRDNGSSTLSSHAKLNIIFL
jgi:hypothetical protein